MATPNEFWLALHTLAESYESEGLTADERAENIIEVFHQMPPMVRRQIRIDLEGLILSLPDLGAMVAAADREDARARQTAPRSKCG